jgi:hypothetical protein
MTTVTSDQDLDRRLAELDAMAAQEWAAYGERLRDLQGRERQGTGGGPDEPRCCRGASGHRSSPCGNIDSLGESPNN